MPDLDQIKQGKQGARDRHGRPPGVDAAGRRTGSRKNSTLAAALPSRGWGLRGRLAQQPVGEILLLICCRCSKMK
jgi:hypothetical protein